MSFVAGNILPCMSVTCIPRLLSRSKFSDLPIRVKIVLKELPITAPPRAVFCWTAVIIPPSSSILTPANSATDAERLKPSMRSLSDTANWLAALLILLRTSPVVKPAFVKLLTAAVNPDTASAALMPESLDKISESLSLFVTSVALKPCLESSNAASATVSNVCSVPLAMSKI